MSANLSANKRPAAQALLFRYFSRSVAEVQWLLVILVLLYLVTTGESLQSSPVLMATIGGYFAFSLAGNYLGFFEVNRALLLAVHTLLMMAFITAILYLTGAIDGPLVSLYLVVIITSALALGKKATMLEVAAVAACYLWLTQNTHAPASMNYSLIAANLVIFVLVGYLTTTLVEAIHSANEHLKEIPRLEHNMDVTLQRWKYVVEQSSDAFLEVDDHGIITEWNPRAASTFGWDREEAIGSDIRELIVPPQLRHEPFSTLQQFFDRDGDDCSDRRRLKATAQRRDGTLFPVEILIHDFQTPDRRYFNAFLRDISERERQQTQLMQMAHLDAVTGLANRHAFDERLRTVIQREHPGTLSLLLLIDLDNLKTINDEHGHPAGDSLLRQVGERIADAARDRDLVARVGGDEFAVLMEQVKPVGESTLRQIARKIVMAIDGIYSIGGNHIAATASIGMAAFPGTASTAEDMIKQADRAMYEAKRAGKNQFRIERCEANAPAHRAMPIAPEATPAPEGANRS